MFDKCFILPWSCLVFSFHWLTEFSISLLSYTAQNMEYFYSCLKLVAARKFRASTITSSLFFGNWGIWAVSSTSFWAWIPDALHRSVCSCYLVEAKNYSGIMEVFAAWNVEENRGETSMCLILCLVSEI